MYTTYSTDAIIFSREGVGEGDLRLEVFTRDFGIVRAKATGARDEKSKLRYSLQTLSRAKVALVSGTRGWRLTGAELLSPAPGGDVRGAARCARVISLVRVVLIANAESDAVYDLCAQHLTSLTTDDDELALVAAILTTLGYVHTDAPDPFAHWLAAVQADRKSVLDMVNNALAANHIAQK